MFIAVLAASAFLVRDAGAENLINNPSNEVHSPTNPTEPLDWVKDGWGTNEAVYDYLSTGHTGNHSLAVKITNYTNGDAKWVCAPEAVCGGARYRFTDWYRADCETMVAARLRMTDGHVEYLGLGVVPPAKNWTPYSKIITIPDGTIEISMLHLLKTVGQLAVDDYSLEPAPVEPFNRGLVSITFDDGWLSQYEHAIPLLGAYAMPATFYIVSNFIDRKCYVTRRQVSTIAETGNEIGSHTVTHPDLSILNGKQLDSELSVSQQALCELLGRPLTDFATPYGSYDDDAMAGIRKQYRSHRSTDTGYNTKDDFDIYNLKVQNVCANTTADEVGRWVSRAAQEKTWLILVYHKIEDDLDAGLYNTTPATFEKHLQTIESGKLRPITVTAALAELTPQLRAKTESARPPSPPAAKSVVQKV